MGQWSMLQGELGVFVHTWSCLLQLPHLPRIDYWLSATQFLMPQALLSLLLPPHPRLLPASTKSCDQIALRRGGSCPSSILPPCGDPGVHVSRMKAENILWCPRAGHSGQHPHPEIAVQWYI